MASAATRQRKLACEGDLPSLIINPLDPTLGPSNIWYSKHLLVNVAFLASTYNSDYRRHRIPQDPILPEAGLPYSASPKSTKSRSGGRC